MLRRSPMTSACALVVSLGLLGAGTATGASLSAAAVPVTGVVAGRTPVAAVEVETADPLTVRIEEMSPAVLTGGGAVTLSGTVTNASDETWTEINLAPFRSAFPITDTATLNAAAALPDDAYVGDRLTDVAAIHKIDELAPGASASFTTRIPRERLGSSPGVYWVGVHARGVTETQPRDVFTDGRARTFLPVADRATSRLPTAVVLPIRLPVEHTADGQVDGTGDWAALLAPDGELGAVLETARDLEGQPVTWLLDPAVPHAVARLAAGNPARTVEALPTEPSESPQPEDELAPDETTAPVMPTPGEEATANEEPATDALTEAATTWLDDFTDVMADAEVLSLPYGDIDVTTVAETRPQLVDDAWTRSEQVLEALGIDATPTIAPPDGQLSRGAVEAAAPDGLVLLAESGLVEDEGPSPTAGTLLGRRFAATSAGVAAGGPGPESPGTPVGVRQRVAAEAALRDVTGDPNPLVVTPPREWEMTDGAGPLLDLLSGPRFRLQGVTTLVRAAQGPTLGARSLVSPAADGRDAHVPATTVRSAVQWVRRAALLESVLTNPAGFDAQVRDVALTELSHHTRRHPEDAAARIEAGRDQVEDLLGAITISGPASATLSGDSGTIGTTLTNDLAVPVTVNVEVDPASEISVEVPNPVAIAPQSRRRMLLQTSASREGVQSLTLRLADERGRPLGGELSVQVRASQVGGLLWLIMGVGGVVLFGAIAVRWFRRGLSVRGKRLDAAPEPAPGPAAATGEAEQA
ncbi:hypothetical protein IEQ44_06160 [Nocardioides sp. Y6]|uniref:Glycoprotein n=1 Tax=Nocardioides malaquae TaxID=2773426 RepID=A0ABR9RS65_9ACTN|nr:DUF6049 family protein [Nocardioides malaquae]MBE7324230.1 hypothetical protein [Nocardioides malaquae]